MANLFQRVTSSWTKPTKRNNYWPLSLAVQDVITTHRTNRATFRSIRKRKRAQKRKGK